MFDDNTIVNHILTTIGEGGVSTLNTLHPSVANAKRILNTEDIAFQARGWWFNKELAIKLAEDSEGRVSVPADALAMTVSGIGQKSATEKLRYVKRGNFIYDTYTHTNVINCPVYVDITVRLSISDMPPAAVNYLMHKCAEVAYVADDGDEQKSNRLREYRAEAWQLLKAQELQVLGANALDNTVATSMRDYTGYRVALYGGGQR
jgi:hypothetical protein